MSSTNVSPLLYGAKSTSRSKFDEDDDDESTSSSSSTYISPKLYKLKPIAKARYNKDNDDDDDDGEDDELVKSVSSLDINHNNKNASITGAAVLKHVDSLLDALTKFQMNTIKTLILYDVGSYMIFNKGESPLLALEQAVAHAVNFNTLKVQLLTGSLQDLAKLEADVVKAKRFVTSRDKRVTILGEIYANVDTYKQKKEAMLGKFPGQAPAYFTGVEQQKNEKGETLREVIKRITSQEEKVQETDLPFLVHVNKGVVEKQKELKK